MSDNARADYGPDRAALYSPEAEEAVLGSVLINPDTLTDVRPLLRADDFHLHKNRWVFDAFLRLVDTERVEWRTRAHFMAVAARTIPAITTVPSAPPRTSRTLNVSLTTSGSSPTSY